MIQASRGAYRAPLYNTAKTQVNITQTEKVKIHAL